MDDELENQSIEKIKEIVKGILNTLPRSSEHALVPMYYKFNEDLETKLDPITDVDVKLYNICLNTGNLSWVKGFQTAMNYCSTTFGLKLKEQPSIEAIRNSTSVNIPITKINSTSVNIPITKINSSGHIITNIPMKKITALPTIIMDWQAFILGIFSASFVWFLLVLFDLLG